MSRSALVIAVDRLHRGYLGPYGNDWIETPELNRLAADAIVFDQALGDLRAWNDPQHAWWQSGHWFEPLRGAGVQTECVTDRSGSEFPVQFDRVITVQGSDGPDDSESAGTWALLMAQAAEAAARLAAADRPGLLWVHSRGVVPPWLPPREFLELYLEEFGLAAPSPCGSAVVLTAAPQGEAEEMEVLHLAGRESDRPYVRAMYAACVSYHDRWLAKLLKLVPQFTEPPLVVFAVAAGEELGEHGEPGVCDAPYSSTLHVPLIVRWPGFDDGSRRQALVSLADLPPTILEWFGLGAAGPAAMSLGPLIRGETDNGHEAIAVAAGEHVGLRTQDYYYLRPASGSADERSEAAELFDKPHDAWDLANVASRYPGVVEEMEGRLKAEG